MKTSCNNKVSGLQSQLVILGMATAFVLSGCGESGTDSGQQSQETTVGSTATDMQAPETAMEDMSTPEPEAAAEAPAEAMNVTATASEEVAAAETAEAPAADGRQVYYTYCAVCHKTGLNAAPKYGNKALWAKRIAQGREVMYRNAIEGLRGMPPRGGIAGLSDEEVKAATDFMVKGSGGWGDS